MEMANFRIFIGLIILFFYIYIPHMHVNVYMFQSVKNLHILGINLYAVENIVNEYDFYSVMETEQ